MMTYVIFIQTTERDPFVMIVFDWGHSVINGMGETLLSLFWKATTIRIWQHGNRTISLWVEYRSCGVYHAIEWEWFLIYVCSLTAGLDIKSLTLNAASLLLFLLPFPLYFYPTQQKEAIIIVAVAMLLGYLMPPMGWRRPHPYSDDESNVPYPRKSK